LLNNLHVGVASLNVKIQLIKMVHQNTHLYKMGGSDYKGEELLSKGLFWNKLIFKGQRNLVGTNERKNCKDFPQYLQNGIALPTKR
jgi:hypothetical protein